MRGAMPVKSACVSKAVFMPIDFRIGPSESVEAYFQREVLPHVPDAWIDEGATKIGYEIPFNRHFYVFKPPRPLEEIDAELKVVTQRIVEMIGGLSA